MIRNCSIVKKRESLKLRKLSRCMILGMVGLISYGLRESRIRGSAISPRHGLLLKSISPYRSELNLTPN